MDRIDNMDLIDTHTGLFERRDKGCKLKSHSTVNIYIKLITFFSFLFFIGIYRKEH